MAKNQAVFNVSNVIANSLYEEVKAIVESAIERNPLTKAQKDAGEVVTVVSVFSSMAYTAKNARWAQYQLNKANAESAPAEKTKAKSGKGASDVMQAIDYDKLAQAMVKAQAKAQAVTAE
jgi:hypothetical protein